VKDLIDECIDWRLAREVSVHTVKTARQMGWSTVKNGALLALAAQECDVFITVDRNLAFQQNLPTFNIAVIVLRARSNRLSELRLLIPQLHDSIAKAKKGSLPMLANQASPSTALLRILTLNP
jgi:hypothetical protein